MKNELWKCIKNGCGKYMVSSHGRVMSFVKCEPKILENFVGSRGYLHVNICLNNSRKTVPVHRLVAETFIGEKPKDKELSHLDGNKLNPKLSNLQYESHAENCKRRKEHGTNNTLMGEAHPLAKLKESDVENIFKLRQEGMLHHEIAKKYNVSRSLIGAILNKKRWGKTIEASLALP